MKSTSKSNAYPAMDNSPPRKYMHLVQNLKKQQMEEERYATIERENTLLLEKMSKIMQQSSIDQGTIEFKPGLRLNAHQYPLLDNYKNYDQKSLNKDFRKRELMRITEENQAILKRIQHKEPFYNHMQWEEERRVIEGYLKNICEFPYSPPKAGEQGPVSGEYLYAPTGESYEQPAYTTEDVVPPAPAAEEAAADAEAAPAEEPKKEEAAEEKQTEAEA